MYNPHPKRKLLADMDKTQLLRMREEGMSNAEIASAVGCCDVTLRKLIGKQPDWITQKNRAAGYSAMVQTKREKYSEGGYTVERKMQSFMPKLPDPEPVKAVLAVKRRDIQLSGAYMHYTVSVDGSCVDVETEQGNVLISVPNDKLEAFIEELTAIKKHIGESKPMEFWG